MIDDEDTLISLMPNLLVLSSMCQSVGLVAGRLKADEMIREIRAKLIKRAPYPFCGCPEKCIPAGKCTKEIVCND